MNFEKFISNKIQLEKYEINLVKSSYIELHLSCRKFSLIPVLLVYKIQRIKMRIS
jgi:hypothetical protein